MSIIPSVYQVDADPHGASIYSTYKFGSQVCSYTVQKWISGDGFEDELSQIVHSQKLCIEDVALPTLELIGVLIKVYF